MSNDYVNHVGKKKAPAVDAGANGRWLHQGLMAAGAMLSTFCAMPVGIILIVVPVEDILLRSIVLPGA